MKLTLISLLSLFLFSGRIYASSIFDFSQQVTLDLLFKNQEDFFTEYSDKYFNHLYKEDISTYILPTENDDENIVELVCKIPIVKEIKELPSHNTLKIGRHQVDAPKFELLENDFGMKLISPIIGRCFNYKEDIWLYTFCIGDNIDQYHVEPNGTISEEFKLGQSNLTKIATEKMIDTYIDDIPDSATYEMVLGDSPYVTIDKTSGLILRFFNTPLKKNISSTKYDMISIAFQTQKGIEYERRTIIEVINDNTIIVDKPFWNVQTLPEYIFDFKNIRLEGKVTDYMDYADRQEHLKSYGLEILHSKFVYCKRCNFALNYKIGDTLVFDYQTSSFASKIVRMIEDNLMEVEELKDHSKQIIVVDDYLILDNFNDSLSWKANKNQNPTIILKGNYAYSNDSLSRSFEVGDKLFISEVAIKFIKSIKNRKISEPVYEIVRFIDNGLGMELKADKIILQDADSEQIETKNYLIGKYNQEAQKEDGQYEEIISQPYLISKFKFESTKEANQYFTTHHQLSKQSIFAFNLFHKQRAIEHRLRIMFHQNGSSPQSQPDIDFVYNSRHGLLINGQFYDLNLNNVTKLFIIMDGNDTLYLANEGLTFAHIFHSQKLAQITYPLQVTFDTYYSDSIELSEMRMIEVMPLKIQQQLNFYLEAPDTSKTYFIEKYTNGTVCAVNKQPRQVTIFYYCDYFNQNEFQLLELSEPDWCNYHVKIATKYMCGKGNIGFKYNVNRDTTEVQCMPRVLAD